MEILIIANQALSKELVQNGIVEELSMSLGTKICLCSSITESEIGKFPTVVVWLSEDDCEKSFTFPTTVKAPIIISSPRIKKDSTEYCTPNDYRGLFIKQAGELKVKLVQQ